MKSMTGFGTLKAQTNEVTIEVSVRAVNGRFLEPRFHLPRLYFVFESDLKKRLSQIVQRGTVDVYVSRKMRTSASAGKISINTKLAQDYHKSFSKLSNELRLKEPIRLDHIIRQPDVIEFIESDTVSQQESVLLKKTFEAALKKFETERQREGLSLKKDLQKNLKDLQKFIYKIAKLRDEANKSLLEKFESKVKSRLPKELAGQAMDPQRLSQEIVIQIEKADINEEVMRLTEHIKNFERLIDSPQVEGKKLDFYTQELLREVNTIGSKSQVSGITESVVESKTLIERIREQVQNVE